MAAKETAASAQKSITRATAQNAMAWHVVIFARLYFWCDVKRDRSLGATIRALSLRCDPCVLFLIMPFQNCLVSSSHNLFSGMKSGGSLASKAFMQCFMNAVLA